MVVESMTVAEIWKEYERDFPAINMLIQKRYGKDSKIRRWLLKNHKHNETKQIFIKSYTEKRSGNTYLIILSSCGYKEFIRKGIRFMVVLMYRKNNRINCIIPTVPRSRVSEPTVFVSHFFERYRERVLDDTSLPITDTIIKFFENNTLFDFDEPTNDIKYGISFTGYCADGIMFGKAESDHLVVKTIISQDYFKNTNSITTSQTFAWNFRIILIRNGGKITIQQKKEYENLIATIPDLEERKELQEHINKHFKEKL